MPKSFYFDYMWCIVDSIPKVFLCHLRCSGVQRVIRNFSGVYVTFWPNFSNAKWHCYHFTTNLFVVVVVVLQPFYTLLEVPTIFGIL